MDTFSYPVTCPTCNGDRHLTFNGGKCPTCHGPGWVYADHTVNNRNQLVRVEVTQ